MDDLTKIALIGTAKYPGAIPAGDHPAASLASSYWADDREGLLLLSCGARSIYVLAGRCCESDIDPTASAPPETKKTASRTLAGLLSGAVSESGNSLLLEFLRVLAAHQVVLPPDLLPQLLESKDTQIRRSLIPILGERGEWLCRQNPDWAHFLTTAECRQNADLEDLRRTWDEGTIDVRCQTIETLRGSDPTRAREWVEEAYSKEKHGNRIKLLESINVGLNGGDEPFLERCLDDRSPAVVQAAASLLCDLPESALAGRMLSRAAAMLTLEKAKLVCTPPADIGPDWERDGIKKKAPDSVGPRAFWTEQVLAAVPPSYWPSKFGLEPGALIAAVTDDTFAAAVISGWKSAVFRFEKVDPAAADWLEPLWQHHAAALASVKNRVMLGQQTDDRRLAINDLFRILYVMSQDVAEAVLARTLEPAPGWQEAEALELLSRWSRPWSIPFGTWFLESARARLLHRTDESVYRWAVALTENACAIPAETFSLALAPWKTPEPGASATWFATAIPREIEKFTAVIEKRQSFLQELNA